MISDGTGGQLRRDDDAINGVNPGDAVQGHVGQKYAQKQLFKIERTRQIRHKKLKIDAVEWIMVDQWGNKYFLFRALLFDGELYDVARWFWKGGIEAPGLVGEFKRFTAVNDALIDFARDSAFLEFGRTNVEIIKAKKLTSAPIAIESHDITHGANLLTKAMRAAGMEVKDETPLDASALLALDEAGKPSITPPLPGAQSPADQADKVIQFPPLPDALKQKLGDKPLPAAGPRRSPRPPAT